MSYRVAIRYRGKTFSDIFTGVQDVRIAGDDGWPRVIFVYENCVKFISTADIMTIDMSEEEEE